MTALSYPAESELERAVARTKSYTGAAVLTFVLYWLLWLPGFIVNVIYYREAKRMERVAGQNLPGVGCLSIMFWWQIVMLALVALLIFGVCGSSSR